ncbi:MAG TPA: acyl-CoA thioesterase II [Candidatus Nanopelagicales bacterium]|nr:acyl-CoA thioesterase II [Candidatus Nanopelagicales bacterium]
MSDVVATVDGLVRLLELARVGDVLRGAAPDTDLQRVFGGQVLGQALMAAGSDVPEGRAPHSLHGYFLRPGDPSTPIDYAVEVLRDGRSFSTRSVVARQHERVIFQCTASFHVDERSGIEHQDPMPDVPWPDDLPSFLHRPGAGDRAIRGEWDALDIRYDDSAGDAVRGWLRTAGPLPDVPLLHAAVLAYASDLTLMAAIVARHGIRFGDPGVVSASLDHAMWFHRPVRVDDWLLHDEESPSASGGRGVGRGRIFSRDGRLVATTVQEGLIRVP